MRIPYRTQCAVAAIALLFALAGQSDARTRKGDKFLAEAQKAEQAKDWDKALAAYEKALATDSGDVAYQMGIRRVRFQAAQFHVDQGQKAREKGDLDAALVEFQKAYATDPGSAIAEQELKRTVEMVERARKAAEAGHAMSAADRALTPAEQVRKDQLDRISRMEEPAELRPLSRSPINLRMSNQAKVLFETVGKLAGINVLFDAEYKNDPNASRQVNIELNNTSLEEALDYVGLMTKSYWRPLSANAIFVTADNPAKRRDYEDSVVKVFYLTNLTTPQELMEITTTLRSVGNIRKVFQYASLSAVIVRGTPDEVMLAQKLINDLDKPKAEVVVDVVVMEASKNKSRDLAATLASSGAAGISTAIQFTPRNPVLLGGSTNNNNSNTSTTDNTTNATLNDILTRLNALSSSSMYGYNNNYNYGNSSSSSTSTDQLMSLARIAKISTNDFSVTMPGALLKAVMSDSNTKILQSPQVRAASGQKATLRIGDKYPIASGGVQPFSGGGTGYSSLYSQFQFVDVGVNVDITPTVHGEKEVTLKAVLEISSVRDTVNVGGISQPVIGQRKVEHEIRIREGEVSLLGGLMQVQDTKSNAGVPGLMNVPGLGHFFSSRSTSRSQNELLIALIPHIVRVPGITDLNLKSVSVGNDTVTKLSYLPRPDGTPTPEAPKAPAATPAAPVPQAPTPTPAAPAPAPVQKDDVMRLMLRPSVTEPKAGSTFTIQLEADNARDLFAAPFHLKFDPQLLRLAEVRAGNMLSGDGQTIIFTRNILNDSGDATVNLNRTPGTGGVSGSGALAVFTFQALKPGNTVVTFTELAPRNSQLQPIQASIPQALVNVK